MNDDTIDICIHKIEEREDMAEGFPKVRKCDDCDGYDVGCVGYGIRRPRGQLEEEELSKMGFTRFEKPFNGVRYRMYKEKEDITLICEQELNGSYTYIGRFKVEGGKLVWLD